MAVLTKVVSGNLYVEPFDMLNHLWEITPNINTRVTVADGKVTMKHGSERVAMLLATPSEDFVFQAKIYHEPRSLSDIGGLMVMADNDNAIECQTYFNGALNLNQFYSYVKVIRESDNYTFYGSKDGLRWEVIGSSNLPDAHKIGFFLDGPENASSRNFIIEEVSVYRANFISFMNIPFGTKIQILNNVRVIMIEKTLDNYDGKTIIDLTDIPCPIANGQIRLYDSSGVLGLSMDVDVAGGDIFDYAVNLVIQINDEDVDPTVPVSLGNVGVSGNEYVITIINRDPQIVRNKRIMVAEYSSYRRGPSFVKVAIENDAGSPGVYGPWMSLPVLLPGSLCRVWMKIERDVSNEAPFYAREYMYKIIIE